MAKTLKQKIWPKSVWPKSAVTVEAPWRDELRKGLGSCCLTVGTVSRCCFSQRVGTVQGDDIFVAGPLQGIAKMGATLKKRWGTRDQMIGAKNP